MKKIFMYLVLSSILVSCATLKSNKVDVFSSADLVGVWGEISEIEKNGTTHEVYTGMIKVINPNNTFYVILNCKGNPFRDLSGTIQNNPFIGLHGTYELGKKDGDFTSYTEHIVSHSLNPTLNGTDSELKYKMIDKNTLLLMYRIKSTGFVGREVWKRISPVK
ncbi:MAG: DUF4488 domain-containing protein [Flavobacteriaceae bacterium]|nr:DUF4488 domain-containing protein [Flavobacteriaceae bacterium]